MAQPHADIGVIGGTGLYQMAGIEDVHEVKPNTPFGTPSDAILIGTLEGKRVAFLPRHARGHRLNPTQVPYQANIFAMKLLGVTQIISVSAVGSLKEEIRPLDIVIPDQLIDRTRLRTNSFFTNGMVVHVAFADPFCADLSSTLHRAASKEDVKVHTGGTYIAMEGPQFSTKAESNLYRSWGASIIGMTALPEAKLAREAEICYATIACSTDYDCWHPSHETVTSQMIIENLGKNVERSKRIVRRAVASLAAGRSCSCHTALSNAIVTSPEQIPANVKKELAPLIGRYIK